MKARQIIIYTALIMLALYLLSCRSVKLNTSKTIENLDSLYEIKQQEKKELEATAKTYSLDIDSSINYAVKIYDTEEVTEKFDTSGKLIEKTTKRSKAKEQTTQKANSSALETRSSALKTSDSKDVNTKTEVKKSAKNANKNKSSNSSIVFAAIAVIVLSVMLFKFPDSLKNAITWLLRLLKIKS